MMNGTDNEHPRLYVLAGGASSRFGSDKALAEVDGVPLVRRVIEGLSTSLLAEPANQHASATLVTGACECYKHLGYSAITDRPCGVGPIGGLNAALHHRLDNIGPGWVLMASCDLLQPTQDWITPLLERLDTSTARAIAYLGDRWEPMLALYHTALLPTVEQHIEQERYAMQSLLKAADAMSVPLPPGHACLPQANTPDQLRQALQQRGVA